MEEQNVTLTFKIVLAGNIGVGKTNLISRFADDLFDENQMSTIGVDFKLKKIDVEGVCVSVQFWDTAGQEKQKSLCK